jgi:hypothetical protein
VVDEVTRSAAKVAALIAVPVAVLAGIGALALLNGTAGNTPDGAAASPVPVATGPVDMQQRELTERQETVCRALVSQLPGSVRDRTQRPVTAGPEQNAAFGDPPITVACGVPPPDVRPTDQVWSLDGVCWYEEVAGHPGTALVTLDREVPVRVAVPAGYDAPGQWAAEFSDPIVSTVLSADDIPTGCEK